MGEVSRSFVVVIERDGKGEWWHERNRAQEVPMIRVEGGGRSEKPRKGGPSSSAGLTMMTLWRLWLLWLGPK